MLMKKTFLMILAAAALIGGAVSCGKEYNDSELRGKIENLEVRVTALEALKTQVEGLQSTVDKLKSGLTVTSVKKENNGFTINFSDGTSATVTSNVIGVTTDNGIYVWTINGEVVKDPQGNPIPVGGQGPQLRDAGDGTLEYSLDGGKTWTPLAGKTDAPTLEETDTAYIIHFGESTLTLPKESPYYLSFAVASNFSIAYGETAEIKYEVKGSADADQNEVGILAVSEGFAAEIAPSGNAAGVVKVTNNNKTATEGRVIVYAANHKGKSDIKTVTFKTEPGDEPAEFEAVIDGGVAEIPADGGDFFLNVKADEDYTVSADVDWITVTPPTRALFEDRLAVHVEKNTTTEARKGTITIRSKESDLVFAVDVNQAAGEEQGGDKPAGFVEEWTIGYAGRGEASNGNIYDWAQVEAWEGEYYDVLALPAGYIDENYDGDVQAFASAYVESAQPYLDQYTMDQIFYTELGYASLGKVLEPGDYTIYLFDVAADCTSTGKWTSAEVSIEEEEPTEEYEALFGYYHMTSGKGRHFDDDFDKVVTSVVEKDVVIQQNVANMSYEVYFLYEYEGEIYGNLSILDWNRNTGGFSYKANANIQTWEHSTYGPIDEFQAGYIYYNSDLYYVTGNYTIGQGDAPGLDGSFKLTAGPKLELNIGKKDVVGLILAGTAEDESVEYWWPHESIPFPMTFAPVNEEADAAAIAAHFEAFKARRSVSSPVQTVRTQAVKATFNYGPYDATRERFSHK